jgi:Tol biopolymer transport system component/DNA-binding winged helix-turn-helix (wHTH) protein
VAAVNIHFGEFELDLGRYELRRGDRVVKLERNPMELLILVVEKQGRLVTREEIIQRLWGDNVFVDTRHGINTAVHKLRTALRDDPERPRIVETVTGKGYRLAAGLAATPPGDASTLARDHDFSADRDVRRQVVTEMGAELQRLKCDTESQRVAVPEAATIAGFTIPYSSLTNRRLVWSGAIFAVLTVAVAGYWFFGRNRDAPFQHFTIAKMTDTGNADIVAISPDGKYVVHVVAENGTSSIWMRHIATNSKTQIIPASSTDYSGLSFSLDGNYIFFVRSESDDPNMYDLFRVPALGGNPKQLVHDVASDVTFSPDGQRMAFCRYLPSTNEAALITTSVEGGEEKRLMTVQRPVAIQPRPAWSPNGKTIVLNIQDPNSEFTGPLISVDSSTGQQQHLLLSSDRIFQNPKWLPDGTGLLVLESDKGMGGRKQVGLVSYPEGRFRQITNDVNGYRSLSVSKDGNLVATVLSESRGTITVSSAVEGTGISESQFVSPMNSPWWNFTWTNNGALLIQQYPKLLILSPGSTAPVDFKDIALGPPDACADGNHIVYLGAVGISRMDASGNNATQITWGTNDFGPVCSHDGKWVYYVDATKGRQKITRVSLEGGTPQQFSGLTPTDIWLDLSRDGKLLVVDVSTTTSHKLAIVSADSGETSRVLEPDKRYWGQPRFTPDSRSIAYQVREDPGIAIWAQSLDGSSGKFITSPHPDVIGNFHWSLDGHKLAVSRIHRERDVALIRNVQ